MIFSLANVPKLYVGQELSAQDLNNLAQNAEILENIVHGPDRLFLSNWRLAPPVFSLVNQYYAQGNPLTFVGYRQAATLSEVDVWEGSFIYREGMHTLRLGFNTFAFIEAGDAKAFFGLDLKDVKSTYERKSQKHQNSDLVNESVSLYLSIKYTDLPTRVQMTQQPKTMRTWVYASNQASAYKQPSDKNRDSFTFVSDSSVNGEVWNANNNKVDGYHTYSINITNFGFVPGEIVNLKFKIGTRDGNAVKAYGRRFYFSMVYANIDHALLDPAWKVIDTASIDSLNYADDIVANQKILVDYFKKYDNPLRASLWDQVMAGGSVHPFYARYQEIAFQGLVNWGFNNPEDYKFMNAHVAQAKYYLPKTFDKKNTVSMSYNVQVNSKTAFSIQAQLSKNATTAGYIYKPRDTDDSYTDPSFVYSRKNIPVRDGQPIESHYPHEVPLGYMNYKDYHMSPEQAELGSFFSRVGKTNFMGTYTYKGTNPDTVIETELLPEGITSVPAGYPSPREFLYNRGGNPQDQDWWHGFYFIRPGRLGDGGVPYYSANGTAPKGLETQMFLGPTAASGEYRDAAFYVDDFNFVLDSQEPAGSVAANTRFYPAMYKNYGGLKTHSKYYITAGQGYTDFTINVKESSNSWSSNVSQFVTGSGVFAERFGYRAFNKASYIATFRLAEVARKESSFVRTPIGRFTSFQQVKHSDLVEFLKKVNTKQNEVYSLITTDPVYKYIPVFWGKPKSYLRHFEKLKIGETSDKTYFYNMELNTVYFSSTRQADYLVVRGRNVSIGWNGFTKIYRDNPVNLLFPAPLQFEFGQSNGLCGSDIETVIIGFDTLEGLTYGQRYYLQGEIFFAAETMGVP